MGFGLTKEEIEAMIADSEKYAEEDKAVKEKIDAKNSFENYVYQMQRSIDDKDKLADKLEEEDNEVAAVASNRSACRLAQERPEEALEDAEFCVKLRSDWAEAHLLSDALTRLGAEAAPLRRLQPSQRDVERLLGSLPASLQIGQGCRLAPPAGSSLPPGDTTSRASVAVVVPCAVLACSSRARPPRRRAP